MRCFLLSFLMFFRFLLQRKGEHFRIVLDIRFFVTISITSTLTTGTISSNLLLCGAVLCCAIQYNGREKLFCGPRGLRRIPCI